MRFTRQVKKWWIEPTLKRNRVFIPTSIRDIDPISNHGIGFSRQSQAGKFAHSRKWVPISELNGLDAGYIVPLYTLKDIQLRYGLSKNGIIYFRKHILPEPFDIYRRRAVNANHWSLFLLFAMDEVLKDLESRGFNQFLKIFQEHIDLLHRGTAFLEEYYTDIAENKITDLTDKYGVQWLE